MTIPSACQRLHHYISTREEICQIEKTKAQKQSEYSKRTNYAAQKRYEAENVKKMMLRLNKNTDADIIAALDVKNPQRELRRLLRLAISFENTTSAE